MAAIRFNLNTKRTRGKLGKLSKVTAADFRPEVEKFARNTLKTAIEITPARHANKIIAAQTRQYAHRIDYIPSFHEVRDPTLIVNDTGEHWMFANGKWYNANVWRLPDSVAGVYQQLLYERHRRMRTSEAQFIDHRKQARFLYKRSWYEVAQSLRLTFAVSAAIIGSKTRRKPAVAPPRAYGQWRGGMQVLSVVIVNRFLDIVTKYWPGNGKRILRESARRNRPQFLRDCKAKMRRLIRQARQTA